jgi:hypothetical protein
VQSGTKQGSTIKHQENVSLDLETLGTKFEDSIDEARRVDGRKWVDDEN